MEKMGNKFSCLIFSLILLVSCSTVKENPVPVKTNEKPQIVLAAPPHRAEVVSVERSQPTMPTKKEEKKPKKKKLYLALECVSPLREFKAGEPAKMTFRMRNYEFKGVFIRGWMANEAQNISLYYVPWKKQKKKPPQEEWLSVKPDIGANPATMTLELAPRNSVLLDVELPFVKDAKVTAPQEYIIYTQIKVDYVINKKQVKTDPFILNSKYIKIKVKP